MEDTNCITNMCSNIASLCYHNNALCYLKQETKYRSGTVNSKSFVGKVLLRIKWKFELN